MKKVNKELIGWVKAHYRPEYKTAITGSKEHLFLVVTRTNYLTSVLWLEWQKTRPQKGLTQLPNKVNWLVMDRTFKREEQQRMQTPK